MSRMPIELSPTERRERVALAVRTGQSNRAIANELNVHEVTVRRDRQFLARPADQRPAKMPRARKPPRAANPALLRKRRWKKIIQVAQNWMLEQTGNLDDVEWILDKAGRILYENRNAQRNVPRSDADFYDLLDQSRPLAVEDDVTGKESRALWFAR